MDSLDEVAQACQARGPVLSYARREPAAAAGAGAFRFGFYAGLGLIAAQLVFLAIVLFLMIVLDALGIASSLVVKLL